MFCPLRNGSEDSDCLQNSCSWWKARDEMCAILSMAIDINTLAEIMQGFEDRDQ